MRDFDSAIRLKPDSDYFINRGIAKRKMGDPAGAITDFDTVIEGNPRNARALYERADSYRALGNRKRAIEDYRTVLELRPSYSYAAFSLGAVLLETGDCERAVTMLKRAIALGHRDSGAAYFFLGRAYQKLGRADLAREALQRSHDMGYSEAKMEGK